MITDRYQLEVAGLTVEVCRGDVGNLHLTVQPPSGDVRISAPAGMADDAVRLAVVDKLGWIRRQRREFAAQERESKREYVTGETHYLWGRRYRLRVAESDDRPVVKLTGGTLMLTVRPNAGRERREAAVRDYYRTRLRDRSAPLIEKWASAIGETPEDWQIRRMKTKWGSCKADARRIWLNLELAKKPIQCLEYVVVHELAHFVERHHNDRFRRDLLDRCLPNWRHSRDLLNAAPLAHEDWQPLTFVRQIEIRSTMFRLTRRSRRS